MSFADVGYRFEYMEWAKTVMEAGTSGVIDAGSNGVARVSLRELGVRARDLELFGSHFYGEPELRRAIAATERVLGEFFGAPGHIRLGIGQKDPCVLGEGLRRLKLALHELEPEPARGPTRTSRQEEADR